MWHSIEFFDLINVINVIKINNLNMTNYDYIVIFDFVAIYIWIELLKQIEVNYNFYVFIYWF
jgi:hypothetical protein